jgi:hypothetical protein
MKSSFRSLTKGAENAVKSIDLQDRICACYSCISVSCVGRKLVLGQRVEDEIEAIFSAFSNKNIMHIGYYSYGEISPTSSAQCDLHNQTMTVMLIGEY